MIISKVVVVAMTMASNNEIIILKGLFIAGSVLIALVLIGWTLESIDRATAYIRKGETKLAENELKYAWDRAADLSALILFWSLGYWVIGPLIGRTYKKRKTAPPPPPPPLQKG
jgi:hypothetical protein